MSVWTDKQAYLLGRGMFGSSVEFVTADTAELAAAWNERTADAAAERFAAAIDALSKDGCGADALSVACAAATGAGADALSAAFAPATDAGAPAREASAAAAGASAASEPVANTVITFNPM